MIDKLKTWMRYFAAALLIALVVGVIWFILIKIAKIIWGISVLFWNI